MIGASFGQSSKDGTELAVAEINNAGGLLNGRKFKLLVEDDQSIREMLVEYLSGQGFEVHQAEQGSDMREEIERNLPDVVLLDVRLPGEDGLTLARFLRERYDIGIIMVTGASDVIDRVVDRSMSPITAADEMLAALRG